MKHVPELSKKNKPNKLLGQHFLVSLDVLAKIISAANIHPEDVVVEVGSGKGILTRALATRAKLVIAVEKDRTLADALSRICSEEKITNVNVITGDILKLDEKALGLPKKYLVAANIPYYITGRFIRMMLECATPPQRMTLMVQYEVAKRITARPPDMNLLGLSVQMFATPEIVARVPPTAFSPQPKVDSAIITISNISRSKFREHSVDPKSFFRIASRAFQGKRKILENTLKEFADPGEIKKVLQHLGISHHRPQELAIEQWLSLATEITKQA